VNLQEALPVIGWTGARDLLTQGDDRFTWWFKKEVGMPENDSIQLIHRFMENHDPSFMAEDATLRDYTMPEPIRGRTAVAQYLDMFYRVAFPGGQAEIRHTVSDGQQVAVEYTFRGVNNGNLMGIPATGRSVEIPMCAVYEVANGAIQAGRVYYDSGLITRQLGLAPAAG